jgi:hypothetical protein
MWWGAEVEQSTNKAAVRSRAVRDHYGDCYYCGGEVLEQEVDLDFRWGGADSTSSREFLLASANSAAKSFLLPLFQRSLTRL